MSVRERIGAALAARILVKDGPYGTEVQALGLDETAFRGSLSVNRDQRGNNDILNLTRPEAIAPHTEPTMSGIVATPEREAGSTCTASK